MKKRTILIISFLLIFLMLLAFGCYLLYHRIFLTPKLSLTGDAVIRLNLDDKHEEYGATAYLQGQNLSDFIQSEGEIDTTKVGKYKIKYTIVYDRKIKTTERTIYVIDTINPIITLKGNAEVVTTLGISYQDEGCMAEDNYDGDITNEVRITGTVDTKTVGDYSIIYKVKDSSGNQSEMVRKVTVKEGKTNITSSSSNKKLESSNNKGRGLPVLMYHFFYDVKIGEKGKDNNWTEISAFEEQMKYLSDNMFYFPSWIEVEAFIDGRITLPDNSVVITIDDGDETFLRLAIPIIEKYNVKATSFLVTSWNGDWVVPKYKSSKLNFQSHSHDMHKSGSDEKGRFLTLSNNKALEDITISRKVIGNATIFCYPFGHYNDTTKKILKEGEYRLAFTIKNGRVYPGADKYALPRIRMSKGDSLTVFKSKVK